MKLLWVLASVMQVAETRCRSNDLLATGRLDDGNHQVCVSRLGFENGDCTGRFLKLVHKQEYNLSNAYTAEV